MLKDKIILASSKLFVFKKPDMVLDHTGVTLMYKSRGRSLSSNVVRVKTGLRMREIIMFACRPSWRKNQKGSVGRYHTAEEL